MVGQSLKENSSPSLMFLCMLAMMCVIALLSSDIYLPALPVIANTLNVQASAMQLTLTVYLFGLSVCQLLYGPLSDKLGRKRVLVIGMLIFIVSTLLCAVSTNFYELVIFRFCQAFGACAGMVMSRAIVGDLYTRAEAAKIFTTIFPVVGASSAIAPIIGGYLTDWISWQACFYFLAIYGLVLFILLKKFLPETKKALSSNNLKRTSRLLEMISMLKNPAFLGFTLIVSSAYAAYFAYIAATPFLFHQYGFNPHQIGYFFILLSVFYIFGNITARRLINIIPINKALSIGITLFLVGSIVMVGSALLGASHDPYRLILPMSLLTAGNGFLFPLGMASTATLFPNSAGTASGLMGFMQLITASFAVGIIGHLTNNEGLPIALFITLNAFIASLSYYFLIYKGVPIYESI